MNLKSFIIASLVVHGLVGIGIYFYYHPIKIEPPVVSNKVPQNKEAIAQTPPPQKQAKSKQLNKKTPAKTKKPALKKSFSKMQEKALKKVLDKKEELLPKEPSLQTALEFKEEEAQTNLNNEAKEPVQLKKEEASKTDSKNQALLDEMEEIEVEEATKEVKALGAEGIKEDLVEAKNQTVDQTLSQKEEGLNLEKEAEMQAESMSDIPKNQALLDEMEEIEVEEATKEVKDKEVEQKAKTKSPALKATYNKSFQVLKKGDTISALKIKQKAGNPPLIFPDFARRSGMQGEVVSLFYITKEGLVDKLQLESSSGHSELDNYVLRTLSRYQFLEPLEKWVRFRQAFVLEGEEKEFLRLRQLPKSN